MPRQDPKKQNRTAWWCPGPQLGSDLLKYYNPPQALEGSVRSDSPESGKRTECREVCCFATESWDLYNFLVVFATPISQRGRGCYSSTFRPPFSPIPEVLGITWPQVDERAQGRLWKWNGTHISALVLLGRVGTTPGALHVLFSGERGRESQNLVLISNRRLKAMPQDTPVTPQKNTPLAEDDHKTRGEPK